MTVVDRSLFLIGFMGCGKSKVGEALARELGRPFVDNDARIEQRDGRTIEAIFEASGEAGFRRVEWDALRSIDLRDPKIVATGGGAFSRFETRRWMKQQGCTVWLDVPLTVARKRVQGGRGRPLWISGDRLALRTLYEQRRAIYALADLRV
jgi:shikimate kinase